MPPDPAQDQETCARIYGALRRARSVPAGRSLESGPPRWDRPELVRMFQRIGLVPSDYKPARAALRVLLAATEMARAHAAPIEEVYATLLACCDTESEAAVCVEPPRCAECPASDYCRRASRRPTIKDMPESERPRERLLAGGPATLTDADLLAILIGGGSRDESAVALAQRLMATFGSLRRVASAGHRELASIKGLGQAKIARIRAGFELGRRLATEPLPAGMGVTGSEQVFQHFRERMKDLKKEAFVCLFLGTKHAVIREEQIAVGSLNESVVHPREVFKSAVNESAAAVLFVHNHPSGDPSPSAQDRKLTERLCRAGELMGIRVLDHIIIGRDEYYSFTERGDIRQ